MQIMGLTLAKLLNDYFGIYELKDALSDIGELTTGTKVELVKRLVAQWEPHNRDKYDLLDYLDEDMLVNLCDDYNIDSDGDENLLKRRIKREKLLDSGPLRPSSMVDDRLISNKKTFEKMGLVDSDSKKVDESKKNSVTKDGAKDTEKSSSHHRISLSKITAICIIIGTIIAVLSYIGLKPH